ncbi:MAG TPA: alpha/beta hydrolase, partial [Chitinophagaceae bacterium]|nr:alpha/beta hydrolase [Chitinophagaceae bacterium]
AIAKPAAEAFKSGNDEKAVSVFIAWVFGDSNIYKSFPPEARSSMLANTLELRGAILSNKPFPEVKCDDMKKIQTPVLLMKGERTTPFFSIIINEIDKCFINNETVILAGATHGLQFDNPGDFNKIVLAFIDKH